MRSTGGNRRRLWSVSESVPGLCGVVAAWKSCLDEEYEVTSRFLRPNGQVSRGYPCLSPVPCGCTHGVVHHAPNDIVGVCRCEPRVCDSHPLERSDIAIYKVDDAALCEAIASALGVPPDHAAVRGLHQTWTAGVLTPVAGSRFPVYLTVQLEPDDLQHVANALVARAEDRFVLAAPTRDMFGADCDETLRSVGAHFLSLEEEFDLDASGTLISQRATEEILAPLLVAALPDSHGSGARTHAAPHGASASPAAGAGPGEPCLGLGPSEVRVVRAYQEWEARRGKRRGLPILPKIDDLEAESELSRPTVIRARQVLRREQILEQVPGARPGTLRLTTRGLRLQLPSDTSTVKPSVK